MNLSFSMILFYPLVEIWKTNNHLEKVFPGAKKKCVVLFQVIPTWQFLAKWAGRLRRLFGNNFQTEKYENDNIQS